MGTITVNRTELGKALDFAALGLSKRPVCPVLAGMLVTVSAGTLTLAAFDYETAAIAETPGQGDGAGRVLVTGAELAAVVKSLPKGRGVRAEITAEDGGLMVICDGIAAVLASLPLDEYPQLPPLPAECGVTDAEGFARTVGRVAACAGTDDTLPALTCVKISSAAGMLEWAGTDRYRLAVDRVPWTGPDGAEALIPARTLATFARKADKKGKITLHLDAERVALSDGARTLITRQCPGEFPRFRSLIPAADSITTTVLADTAGLAAAVTRAGKLAERGVPVTLDITAEGITVTVMRDGEVISSQLVDAAYEGEAMTVRFHAAYLVSVLAGVEDYGAWLSFRSDSKPVLVTGGDEFAGVCMPVRLAG